MNKIIASLALSLTLGALTVQANPIVHNITNVTDLASSDSGRINVIGTEGEAAAFTTGSATSTVYSVQMMLDAISISTTVAVPGQSGTGAQPRGTGVTYDALLFSNSGGAPGSQLYNLGTSLNATTNNLVTFTAPTNSYLAANTTYWLVLEMNSLGGAGGWQDTGTLTSSSPAGWTIAAGYDSDPSSWSKTSSTITPLFSIEVTPEPGTLALAGLGVVVLGRFRRQR